MFTAAALDACSSSGRRTRRVGLPSVPPPKTAGGAATFPGSGKVANVSSETMTGGGVDVPGSNAGVSNSAITELSIAGLVTGVMVILTVAVAVSPSMSVVR